MPAGLRPRQSSARVYLSACGHSSWLTFVRPTVPSPFAALRNFIRTIVPIRVRGIPDRAYWLNTRPLSQSWGFDRGTPIDRYFIESFLARHADAIRGRVLE